MDTIRRTNEIKKYLEKAWEGDEGMFDLEENRFYPSDSTFFEVITFGNNACFRMHGDLMSWAKACFSKADAKRVLDSEGTYLIDSKLRSYGKMLSGQNVRYVYSDTSKNLKAPHGYRYESYDKDSIANLYDFKGFDNALNYKTDVIGVGAYCEEKLIALAAADDYYGELRQVGIDTVKEHRVKGLAAYLVNTLAKMIEKEGRVSFYNTWSPNIASTKVALGAGYTPLNVSYHSINMEFRG